MRTRASSAARRRSRRAAALVLLLLTGASCAQSEAQRTPAQVETSSDGSALETRVQDCLAAGEFQQAIELTAFLPALVPADDGASEVRAQLARLQRLREEALILREFAALDIGVKVEIRMERSTLPPFESRPRA